MLCTTKEVVHVNKEFRNSGSRSPKTFELCQIGESYIRHITMYFFFGQPWMKCMWEMIGISWKADLNTYTPLTICEWIFWNYSLYYFCSALHQVQQPQSYSLHALEKERKHDMKYWCWLFICSARRCLHNKLHCSLSVTNFCYSKTNWEEVNCSSLFHKSTSFHFNPAVS